MNEWTNRHICGAWNRKLMLVQNKGVRIWVITWQADQNRHNLGRWKNKNTVHKNNEKKKARLELFNTRTFPNSSRNPAVRLAGEAWCFYRAEPAGNSRGSAAAAGGTPTFLVAAAVSDRRRHVLHIATGLQAVPSSELLRVTHTVDAHARESVHTPLRSDLRLRGVYRRAKWFLNIFMKTFFQEKNLSWFQSKV